MISLLLGDEEYDSVENARRALSYSRSEYVRKAILGSLPIERPAGVDSEAVDALCKVAGELTRLAWRHDNKGPISKAAVDIELIRKQVEGTRN
jgi:hypothetical protein